MSKSQSENNGFKPGREVPSAAASRRSRGAFDQPAAEAEIVRIDPEGCGLPPCQRNRPRRLRQSGMGCRGRAIRAGAFNTSRSRDPGWGSLGWVAQAGISLPAGPAVAAPRARWHRLVIARSPGPRMWQKTGPAGIKIARHRKANLIHCQLFSGTRGMLPQADGHPGCPASRAPLLRAAGAGQAAAGARQTLGRCSRMRWLNA
jgi:hypothetical protein